MLLDSAGPVQTRESESLITQKAPDRRAGDAAGKRGRNGSLLGGFFGAGSGVAGRIDLQDGRTGPACPDTASGDVNPTASQERKDAVPGGGHDGAEPPPVCHRVV